MTRDDVPSRFDVDLEGATLVGIYRVERKIADGGMGSVWLGEDTNLGRKVVVKVPHARFLGEAGFRTRFRREITELVRLEHPSIVRILAQGEHDEIPFFVLQYLGGGSLEERLEVAGAGPRSTDVVLRWLRTIAGTLDFIHARGVVHRDVKPENILFDEEGHVFLSDFGVVKALEEDLSVTQEGTGVGSPRYMAPEQALGRPVEGAADQYGLATTVYEAITGRLPFVGESALEVLLAKHKVSPTPIADLAPDLAQASADAVMRALSSDPAARFPTCQAFADAFLQGLGIYDRTPASGVATVGAQATTSQRPAWTTALAIFGMLAVALLGAAYAVGLFSKPNAAPTGRGDPTADPPVVLVSQGQEPRSRLRYRPAIGTEDLVRIHMETEEQRKVADGEEAPGMVLHVDLDVSFRITDVEKNGDIAYAWNVKRLSLDLRDEEAPGATALLAELAQALSTRSGAGRQSARGINQTLRHDEPPPSTPALRPFFGIIAEFARQPSTPLPEEPVGIGARWEITTTKQHIEGVRITQTATYELVSIEGDDVQLKMYVGVMAPNQAFQGPMMPPEAKFRLKHVAGRGEGDVRLALDGLADEAMDMNVESSTELSMVTEEEERVITVDRVLRVTSRRAE